MGCSHSTPSPGEGPPQGPTPVREEAPATQPSIRNPATTGSGQQQSSTAYHGPWQQQSSHIDPGPPPPGTNDSAAAVKHKPTSSISAASTSNVVTPDHIRTSLTDERKQLLQSIRERPGMAGQDQFGPLQSRVAMDTRVVFSQAMQRGDRITPRYNSLYDFNALLYLFACSYSYHG